MQPSNRPIRKRAFVAAATFALITLGLTALACAGESTEENVTQKANIQIVNDFMDAWSDPDKAVTYLDPNASVRMIEDQPAVVGRAAIADVFKSFMKPGVTLEVDTLESMARGPVVMNKRIDTMRTPGKPEQVFPVVGVFVVKDGKITEWTDYLDK